MLYSSLVLGRGRLGEAGDCMAPTPKKMKCAHVAKPQMLGYIYHWEGWWYQYPSKLDVSGGKVYVQT